MGPEKAKRWAGILGATTMPKPVCEYEPEKLDYAKWTKFARILQEWIKSGHDPRERAGEYREFAYVISNVREALGRLAKGNG